VKVGVALKTAYSASRVAARVASLGRAISRDYDGRTLDVVIILENAFLFGADLVRRINRPVVCHFVRSQMRDFEQGGHARREIVFTHQPNLRGRDVLVVDTLVHSGVTQDFLVKRLEESRPRSLRLAVLLDRQAARKVDLKPDYFGFVAASKYLVGYGLSGGRGLYRNLPFLGELAASRRAPGGRLRTRRKTRQTRKS
jgi:hypoxanthine phosphoribosyltransferase